MKNLFITILTLFIAQSCTAQQKKMEASDLTSNKYFKSANISNLVGKWASSDGSYVAVTSTKIKSLQKGDVRIRIDVIVITFEKFMYNNKDISFELKNIELYSSSNSTLYNGEYKDPITNNTIKLFIKYIDKHNVQILCTESIVGDSKKGTIFPSKIDLVSTM